MTKKSTPHPKIGETPGPDDQPGVFCLILEEWFDVKPTQCKHPGCEPIKTTVNAFNYFITSGEAVQKVERLNQDAWKFAGRCKALLTALKKAKGESQYLEITSEDGMLVCRRKDPRNKTKRPDGEEQSI